MTLAKLASRPLIAARMAAFLLGSALTFQPLIASSTLPASGTLQQDDAKPGKDDATGRGTKKQCSGKHHEPVPSSDVKAAVIWEQPADIPSLNLFYGQGGEKHVPEPPFRYLKEDTNGTNPKFDVRDGNEKKWRVKLGEEARPEVTASRLLWAVGYFANDDYLLKTADVPGLTKLRGKAQPQQVTDARFARKPGGQDKIGIWRWKDNRFTGTREFNGLRVMMAVLNNWDLKDENNSVYTDEKKDRQIFLVSDVGASFATNNRRISRAADKGNVDSYRESKFITKKTAKTVSFGTPAPPTGALAESGGILVRDYFRRRGLQWIGQDIPIDDARWVGSLLAQLSHEQIVDAFRAANFPDDEIVTFVQIVEDRIQELKQL